MARMRKEHKNPERSWTGASWLAAAVALATLLFAFSSLVHRFRLPTDGWALTRVEGNLDHSVVMISEDVMGFPSDLRRGDILVKVGGEYVDPDSLPFFGLSRPVRWVAGHLAVYQVARGDLTFNLLVPLGHWGGAEFATWMAARSVGFLPAITYAIFAFLVFLLRPGNRSAQVLLVLGAVSLSINAGGMAVPLSAADFFDPFAYASVNFLDNYAWGILLLPTIILLTLVFPKPKQFFMSHSRLVLLFLYGVTPLLYALSGWSRQTGWAVVAFFALLALGAVIHSFLDARRDPVARAQVVWVLMGLGVLLVWRFFENVILILLISQNINVEIGGTGVEILNLLSSLAFPLSLAIAVLRYRLFDIDVLIRRTLVYAMLTLTLGGMYLLGIILLQRLFRVVLGQESPLAIVISTLAIAGLFNPLRLRMQEMINRRFYRHRYNAENALVSFSAAARSEVDLVQISDRLLSVVDDTIQPEHAELWIRRTRST